jgi:hypothetical protein
MVLLAGQEVAEQVGYQWLILTPWKWCKLHFIPGAKLGKKIAWCTAAANKLKWKVYMLVWAVFEPEIVSHGALPLDLPGAYSKI